MGRSKKTTSKQSALSSQDPKRLETEISSKISTSTRVPPTASNRKKKLELERLKKRIIEEENSSSQGEEEEPRANVSESSGSEEEHIGGSNQVEENVIEDEPWDEGDEDIEEESDSEAEHLTRKNKGKNLMTESSTQEEPTELSLSLLFAYKDHIASSIWNSMAPREEARIVKLHSHVGTHKRWKLENECDFVKNAVVESGFEPIIKHAHEKVDKALINAFIERFYPETNTFHLPFGEMTISIDETFHITGLPVDGKPVTGTLGGSRGISDEDVYDLLDKCLGVKEEMANATLGGEKKVRLEWLRTTFSGSQESDTTSRKRQCAIAYLLYTIGVLVCGDKSGNKVSVHFLQCLRELRQVHTYSWGTACLSWLFYNLAQGTRKGVRQIAGCMTLLQVWIYEHFPILRRHNRSIRTAIGDARASFYFAMEPSNNLAYDLVSLREKIDDLKGSDVVWDFLKDIRDYYPFQRCALYNGPIVCFEVVELYLPQRILRQFGFVQPIPATTFSLESKKTKSSAKSYKAAYYNFGDFSWSEWRNHLLNESLLSTRAVCPWECDAMYMEWYKSMSHPYVANPQTRFTEPVHNSDQSSLVVRIKRRLRHIAEFIRSCTPSDSMSQVLERVERIEEDEPLDIYGEDQVEVSKAKKSKHVSKSKKK